MQPLIQTVIRVLEAELADVERRAVHAAEGATHEESRPEDPKDTRGLETSYLAHGLAKRAAALQDDIRALRSVPPRSFDDDSRIAAGARVTLEDSDGETSEVALLPAAGGVEVEMSGTPVRVVTPTAPLGRAILDRECGDDIELTIAGRRREWVIVAIRSIG